MLINQNSSTTSFTVCLLLDCPVCQRCLRSTLVPSSACPECGCSTGTQPQSTVTSHRRWSNSIAYQYSTTSGAVLMHRILLCQCPPYLVDLFTFTPNIIHWHRLRLSTARAAIIQRVRTQLARAFSVSGPAIWNSVPSTLHSIDSHQRFWCEFKTHFSELAFS